MDGSGRQVGSTWRAPVRAVWTTPELLRDLRLCGFAAAQRRLGAKAPARRRCTTGGTAGRRKTFDALLTSVGLLLAVLLLAAGGLLTWGHNFVSDQIHTQLAAQKISIPAAGSKALEDPAMKPYLTKYGGQQLTTGDQAGAYADHFIAVHLKATGGGQTYAQLSTKAQADPTNTALAAQVNTMFKGETVRGLLLNAYAFGTMAELAGIAAIGAFVGAALLLVLSALGFPHLRRVGENVELLVPGRHPEPSPV